MVILPEKCTCKCHEPEEPVMHLVPCCDKAEGRPKTVSETFIDMQLMVIASNKAMRKVEEERDA